MDDVNRTVAEKLASDIADLIMQSREQRIELALQTRPWWLPRRLWFWLLSKVLRLDVWPDNMQWRVQ